MSSHDFLDLLESSHAPVTFNFLSCNRRKNQGLFRRITMKNQRLITALLAIVLPILGACSNPVNLETTAARSNLGLRPQAVANIVPNEVWQATDTFQLRAYYEHASTFATTLNGVVIGVTYNVLDLFHSQKLEFEPGKQANTLTSRVSTYVATATAKISGVRNCTYNLGPQEFSVPADTITLTFDPTRNPDPNNYDERRYPKDWIYTSVTGGFEVVSVDASLKSVCNGPYRGQTTTTYTPVTLFRTAQPARPIIGRTNQIYLADHFVNPNLEAMSIGTFPSGGLHLWR
jgi:hypothetical protein